MTFARGYVRGWLIGKAIGLAILGVIVLVTGCPAPMPPPNPPGPPPTTPATCVKACDHLRRDLLCDTGEGCAELCVRVGDQRFTDCLAAAPTCASADRCDAR